MYKKLLSIIIACSFLTTNIHVFAEDYSNTDDWIKLCSRNELTDEEKKSCEEFIIFKNSESSSLSEELKKLEKEREIISTDIAKYGKEIAGYDIKISSLNSEITILNEKISIKEKEILTKTEEIKNKENEINVLNQKIKTRMASNQSSMHLNQYVDILMGAKDLNDLLRRSNGLKYISSYDENNREQLKVLIDELTVSKLQLEEDKQLLENDKTAVTAKQNEIILMRRKAEIAKEEAQKKEVELEAEGNRIAGNLEQIKKDLSALSTSIDSISSSSGFTRPINGGKISEGTWYYKSGGIHLGLDFAPGAGAPIKAVGNGIIIKSTDGCPTGYLGSNCGSAQGGSSGGGNQIYLLTVINDVLYAVKYLHMLQGTPIAQNTIVYAGDVVGQVGSSGNSTGNHCHVEVFKLGSMSINEYISSWNGDLAFGTGWGKNALSTTCETKGAPCRMKPESIF
ncbi:peptidoglycan DD-metalloendopeptidase family protein [Anaerorhabdus sp.]|uniref:murein hydrolase activator EnvC family protein n=1 Tax=Anaerorhabdus sp. TaxID=1872524 RepID=UPI002B1EDEE1|nr:peptidoglycan DD-metalloendopeptidase family protein [Anaerorhabdus sp.]MEA4874574.1 peptidoglycan DD-metalloendopeptidase family protein [Anaerorhabdus sp.]